MPERAKRNERMMILMRLIIDLSREAYASRNDDDYFGANWERALLMMAVAIGQMEGRPMSASKIAQYIGVPRATASRKLDELSAMGLLSKNDQKQFVIVSLDVHAPRLAHAIDAMERLVRMASTELSRLDSVAIAGLK
jgi:DNA-binding transcriptional ArsR family regulator